MNNVVINSVCFVIHNVISVVFIQLHFKVTVLQGLSCANFNIDLITFLSLHVSICDEDFCFVILVLSIEFLAVFQRLRCKIITPTVIVEISVDAPVWMRVVRFVH